MKILRLTMWVVKIKCSDAVFLWNGQVEAYTTRALAREAVNRHRVWNPGLTIHAVKVSMDITEL